jgi:glycosyltransferase involved in cell wall biosynthesis/SAM-dependent methyltransferase
MGEIIKRPNPPTALSVSGERLTSGYRGQTMIEHMHRYLLAREWCRDLSVLDIASGEGYGSALLAQVATSVLGVDISAEAVAHARTAYKRDNLDFVVGDARLLPAADGSFDVVVSFETIEHYGEQAQFLAEVRRVLRPEGLFIVSTPDRDNYSPADTEANPYHARELTEEEFRSLLQVQFKNVGLLMQRPVHGSVLLAAQPEAASPPLCFERRGDHHFEGSAGLARPQYIVAFASNSALPALPPSVYIDTGKLGLLNPLEYEASLDQMRTEMNQRGEALTQANAALETARADLGKTREALAELNHIAMEAHAALDRLRGETAAGTAAHLAAEAQCTFLKGELLTARQTLQADLQAARNAAADAHAALDAARRELTQAREQAAMQIRAITNTVTAQKNEAISALSVKLEAVEALLAATYNSTSWRVSKPVRAISMLLRTIRRNRAAEAPRHLPGPAGAAPVGDAPAGGHGASSTASRDSGPGKLTLLEQLTANYAPGPHFEPDLGGQLAPADPKLSLIAFYLPQFHPIAENDEWWGKGFTEWTNVTKALPRFAGHVQPQLPSDLGFYDLTNRDTMARQIELAKRYGIAGFCFHHYWFNGRRILETPLNMLLADPSLDMPFCINWANENWTRRWDGHDEDVLLAQHYSPEDDIAFAESLIPIVSDPRYIRINGRPLVMLYRPGILPEPQATVQRWRDVFAKAGLANPYLVMAQAFGDIDPRPYGFDAATEFPPHKVGITPPINAKLHIFDDSYSGHVLDYGEVARHATSLPAPDFRLFRCVCPGWDNEARKPGRGYALANATPRLYGTWLKAAARAAQAEIPDRDERIVFINAWNEWAEGAHLEPDRHFGHAYLAETARVLAGLDVKARQRPAASVIAGDDTQLALVVHDAHLHGAQMLGLSLAKTFTGEFGLNLHILIGGVGELTPQFEQVATTRTLAEDFNNPRVWQEAARSLAAAGVGAVILNTLVSAKATIPFRDAGLRIVQLVHELPSTIRQYGLEAASLDAARNAAVLVFASAYVRDRFLEAYGPASGQVIIRPQGLYMKPLAAPQRAATRAEARQRLGVRDDQALVLGLGYGDMRKGLDLWPALMRRVLKTCPETMFAWIGKIDPTIRRWLEHDLEESGLARHFLAPGPTDDAASLYPAADVFVLTSREDPFPSVVMEAMASGVPTIVFEDSGGIVDMVKTAGGFTAPYLDTEAMGERIAALLSDRKAAAEMGAKLAASIAQNFNFADYAADLIGLTREPFVSVIVPNYNYARYLRLRLESIWAQTVKVREIIVLDDASTDHSDAVIRELMQESPIPINYVRNEANSGSVSKQWAKGVALAKGDFVWIAEADDFADPEFLAGVLPVFQNKDVAFGYTQSRIVDEHDRVTDPDYLFYVADIDPDRWRRDFIVKGTEEIAEAMVVKNTVPNVSAVVFRRVDLAEVLNQHLDEMISFRNAADWLCYVRLLQRGGSVGFIKTPLNNHRRHQTGVTISSFHRQQYEEIVAMQDLAAAAVPITPAMREKVLTYRSKIAKQFGLSTADGD